MSSVFKHTERQNLTLKSTKNVKNSNNSATEQNAILTLAAPVTEAYTVQSLYIYSYLALIVIFGNIYLMVCLMTL
jgi:hypothetical protein